MTEDWGCLSPQTFSVCLAIVVWLDSVIDATDLWFRSIEVPDAHNTHVAGGHVSVDGSGGDPESARVWNLWHLLFWCGKISNPFNARVIFRPNSLKKHQVESAFLHNSYNIFDLN